ncbi:hypothetical protein CNECB9_3480098 [Cupriavidus necator]|uniref:Uncharacterized protein n=1 Tax=Cupriavidus necator TaxID=106590 RepID=A0A1K0IV80_CUPNE|nr:hypothetical protein CNECB9_3480098 [Cupriavidus necator]
MGLTQFCRCGGRSLQLEVPIKLELVVVMRPHPADQVATDFAALKKLKLPIETEFA